MIRVERSGDVVLLGDTKIPLDEVPDVIRRLVDAVMLASTEWVAPPLHIVTEPRPLTWVRRTAGDYAALLPDGTRARVAIVDEHWQGFIGETPVAHGAKMREVQIAVEERVRNG